MTACLPKRLYGESTWLANWGPKRAKRIPSYESTVRAAPNKSWWISLISRTFVLHPFGRTYLKISWAALMGFESLIVNLLF